MLQMKRHQGAKDRVGCRRGVVVPFLRPTRGVIAPVWREEGHVHELGKRYLAALGYEPFDPALDPVRHVRWF